MDVMQKNENIVWHKPIANVKNKHAR